MIIVIDQPEPDEFQVVMIPCTVLVIDMSGRQPVVSFVERLAERAAVDRLAAVAVGVIAAGRRGIRAAAGGIPK